ncbi:MAG: class I SAM-dependent methyltransferase [Pseudonocardiaceae bacterium]
MLRWRDYGGNPDMHDVMAQPWGAVEQLLLAAGSGPERLNATVQQIGLEPTVDVIVEELVVRCDPPPLDLVCRFQLEVVHGTECTGRVLTIGSGGMEVEPGWSETVLARIRFVAVDLVESLFGPAEHGEPSQRDVTWSEMSPDLNGTTTAQAFFGRWQQMTSAMHAVLAACEAHPIDLGGLSARFGSDKWANFHWYTQHYDRHFSRLRTKPVRLLEIGIGGYQYEDMGGASLRMWQRYFSRGLVYGLDIFPKSGVRGPRMRTVQGDQSDPEFLDELGRRRGPFDIVIDDGSHLNDHVKTAFGSLFPHVRPGGLYVIEDLQTAYWPGYGGDDQDLTNADTSIRMLKALVDGLNHQELPKNNKKTPSYTDQHVVGLHFYHNLAIIEKGVNAEDGAPSFIPRRPV